MRILNPVVGAILTLGGRFLRVLLAFFSTTFLVAHQSHGTNAVCHPPSHRATWILRDGKIYAAGFLAAVLPDMRGTSLTVASCGQRFPIAALC
jgi:hypothetical protein